MLLVLFCRAAGWVLAHCPERLLALFCRAAGNLIYALPLGRVRSVRSNLHHAFPERDRAWLDRAGRMSFQRLAEMALFALASPHFEQRWFETHLLMDDPTREALRKSLASSHGFVGLLPHFTLSEMLCALPAIEPGAAGAATLYRPVKPPALDAWLKRVRTRWGLDLLARRDALHQANSRLRAGNPVVLLFDQNTGRRGKLLFFFDRLASATHFPGLLARRSQSSAWLVLPCRTGFWKCRLEFRPLPGSALGPAKTENEENTPAAITISSNRLLETYLRDSEDHCADWLWSHNRWQTQEQPRRRFQLEPRNSYLDLWMADAGLAVYPRRTRFWIRMPNWLGDVVMTVPLLRALRRGRPDAELTLVAPPHFVPLLQMWDIADEVRALPRRASNPFPYWRRIRSWRRDYPDTWVAFTNSFRGDLEGRLTGAPQRFGILRPGKHRPLLTSVWKVPPKLDEAAIHQTALWEKFLRRFGLLEAPDFSPLATPGSKADSVGLICGTENSPEKRWPVRHWKEVVQNLIESTPQRVVLFGTARDRGITSAVAEGFPSDRIENRAGQTTLTGFAAALQRCRLMICNDTGGMHLANALGVPLVAVFGPTNPIRTGPVFRAPFQVIQPPGCPAQGGAEIGEVLPGAVLEGAARLSLFPPHLLPEQKKLDPRPPRTAPPRP
ncbi:MAG TPA: glycosyltransferase family 9 protein [Verrucomicrobiales bacterium]|nr:glycosyltransferase family 9 protein [Verrucomicrobiales bacterium]